MASSLKAPVFLCVIGAWLTFAPAAQARTETVLYSFCQTSGCPDGQDPYSPMVRDANGNLYGTTLAGGNASNAGTIYELQKVKRTWVFHSLYSFCSQANCTDGSTPYGGLIVDTAGNLYGTTLAGGNANEGVVYQLQKKGSFKVLYSFCPQSGCADGAKPYAGLTYQGQQNGELYDGNSTLYGTSSSGGTSQGVVYSLIPSGESVLYAFGTANTVDDGVEPLAPLIMDGAGNLYGTTNQGGVGDGGIIFCVSPTGSETILYSFGGQGRATYPGTGALLMEQSGAFVGVTPRGGIYGEGALYSLADGAYTTLATFCRPHNCPSGGDPQGALIENASGNLYGVAPLGGRKGNDNGTVFELSGSTFERKYSFCAETNCTDGAHPYSRLIMNGRGALFGTTTDGGTYNGGTIFELP